MFTLWQEATRVPASLQLTLDRADGFDAAAKLIAVPSTRRIVVSGNGASYYVAHALAATALGSDVSFPDVLAVPAGTLNSDGFAWRSTDVLMGLSSSGELNDLIAARERARGVPFVIITASASSTLAATADAVALTQVIDHEAMTHTQAYCSAVAAAYSVWARAVCDGGLARLLSDLPRLAARASSNAVEFGASLAFDDMPQAAIAYGAGAAWSAALEAALLLKEVAGIPAEGTETREGATSAMFALRQGHVAVSLHTAEDAHIVGADARCRERGAQVLVIDGTRSDGRLAPVTTFFAALQLAIHAAQRAGRDPDVPDWTANYLQAVRTP